MRKWLLLSLCFPIIFAMGCKSKSGGSANNGSVTIRMWIMPNSAQPVGDLQEILKPFTATHPNIKVEVTSIDWGSAKDKLNSAAISGVGPDITQMGTTWVGLVSATDALEPLDSHVAGLGGGSTFLPAAWSTAGIEGSGKVTSIPWFIDARVLYYRKDVFDKLHLTEKDIASWEGFKATLDKIKKAKLVLYDQTVEPLGSPGSNDWNILHNIAPWIWSGGGDLLSGDRGKAVFNNEAAAKGVNFFLGLALEGYIPKYCLELNTAQVAAKFNEGAFAMYFDTPAQVKNLELPIEKGGAAGTVAARNYAIALYPSGPAGRFTFFGGSNLAIFKSSDHKNEAWQVVEYLASKPAQLAYAKATGFVPARKDAFDDAYFTEHPKRKIFIEAVKYGRTYPCVSAIGAAEPGLMRHFGNLWAQVSGTFGAKQSVSVQKELDDAVAELNIIISESK